MSVVLAIDTTADRLQLALRRGDGRTDTLVEPMRQGHAEALFPAIATLLARNGFAYADVSRIAVTTGPGSFTGLRVGLSAARGLALALGVPVIGIPTLTAISLAAEEASCTVLLDARRGEAWFQRFGGANADPAPMVLPMLEARVRITPGNLVIESPIVDIARLAEFAANADPAVFPPDAAYVRPADARPQEGARIARIGDAAP